VAWLCAGEVGAVLCFDASRLARNGRDWHHLHELCGLLQEAIRLIFTRFRELGSARQVSLSMRSNQIHFPRPSDGKQMIVFDWTPIRYRTVISVLKNPFYAGFTFTENLRSGLMGCGKLITLDFRVAIAPPIPPLCLGSAEPRSSSFPEARLPSPRTPNRRGRALARGHGSGCPSLSASRSVAPVPHQLSIIRRARFPSKF
jgi:Recombinase